MLLGTMKRIVSIVVLFLMVTTLWGQQAKEARKILDQTANQIHSGGGVQVSFTVVTTKDQRYIDKSNGLLFLQDDCFKLEASDLRSWFDGKTQWSYLLVNEEVNIINPTEEELESINPYRLLLSYKKGYSYAIGKTTNYKSKQVVEVLLKSVKKDRDIESVVLYIDKFSHLPLYLKVRLQDRTESEITVKEYHQNQKYDQSFFQFDESKYPSVEIIDLR